MDYKASEILPRFIKASLFVAVGYIGVSLVAWDTNYYHVVCVKSSPVDKILSVDYRNSTFVLEDGTQLTRSQETIIPGHAYCYSSKRERSVSAQISRYRGTGSGSNERLTRLPSERIICV